MDQNLWPQSWLFLRQYSPNTQGDSIKFEVVDLKSKLLQWAAIANYSMGPDYRIWCLQARLGCQLSRNKYRWTMSSFGTVKTHKLTGDEGSLSGLTIILLEENIYFSSPSNGQYYSDFLLEQVRRQPLMTLIRPSQRNLDLVHPKENNHPCGKLARIREYPCRLGEPTPYRLQQLETRQEDLLELRQETGPIHNRPICLHDVCSGNQMLQLKTWYHSICSGCTVNIMEQPSSVLVPTIHLYWSLAVWQKSGKRRFQLYWLPRCGPITFGFLSCWAAWWTHWFFFHPSRTLWLALLARIIH